MLKLEDLIPFRKTRRSANSVEASTPPKHSANVFICYAPEDAEFVRDLDEALRKRRRVSALDGVGLTSRAASAKLVNSHILSAETFLFIISPDSLKSSVCKDQLAQAIKLRKRIVPVLRREVQPNTIPASLDGLDLISYRESDEVSTAFQSVVAAIETNLSVDVFICYSRKDTDFVNMLYQALNERDRRVWIDLKSIPFTGAWEQEIYAGIEAANNFVFVLSPDSISSEFCIKELNHAVKHNKRLVPILATEVDDNKVPASVAAIQRIPFLRDEDFSSAFDRFITAIDTDLNYVHEHTRLLTRARDWEKRGQDKSLLLFGSDLGEAERLAQLNKDRDPKPTSLQLQYILTSRQNANRNQRIRFAAVTVALVVAIGLALFAYQQSLAAESGRRTAEHEKQIADEQRNIAIGERGRAQKAAYDAEQARNEAVTAKDQAVKSAELEKIARQQADEARNEAEQNLIRSQAKTAAVESLRNIETDPAASVAFATRSLELFPSDEARSLLANALVNLPSFNSFQIHASPVKKGDVRFSTVKGMAEEIQFVEGGRYLVVRQKPGFVEVRDAVTGTTVRRIENVRPGTPWSMDGAHQRLSLILNDGSLTVLDFRQSSGVRELLKLAGPYALTTLSYDGEHLITVDGKGEVGLTSLQSRAYVPLYSGVTPVSLNVNRNMTRLVTLDGEGNTTIRALPSGTVVSSFKAEITKHVPDLRSEFKLLLARDPGNSLRDPNERPIPDLFIADRVTDLISTYIAEDPELIKKLEENAKSFDKTTRNKGEAIVADDSSFDGIDTLIPEIAKRIAAKQFAPDCRPEIRFGLDDDVIFLSCRSEAFMFTELWDTKGTPRRVSNLSGEFGTFDMNADGSHLAVAGADSIVVYAVARGDNNGQLSFRFMDGWPIAYPDSRIGPPRELRFSPNGGILLALHAPFVLLQGTPQATVSLWYTHPVDARDGNDHQGIKLHPHTILSTTSAFSPEANQIATYSVDGTIRVWRISRDRELFTVKGTLSERAVTSLFRGYKYLPAETWDALNPLFTSDRSLLDAVQRVTRRSLTAEELQRFSLTAQKSTTKVAKGLSSRPTIPLKELVTRSGQIAVQN